MTHPILNLLTTLQTLLPSPPHCTRLNSKFPCSIINFYARIHQNYWWTLEELYLGMTQVCKFRLFWMRSTPKQSDLKRIYCIWIFKIKSPPETEYTFSTNHCKTGNSLPVLFGSADLVNDGAEEDEHVLQEYSNSRPLGLDINCKVKVYNINYFLLI